MKARLLIYFGLSLILLIIALILFSHLSITVNNPLVSS